MKTFCIKTNNKTIINYLLEDLKKLDLTDVYFSCHKFKVFNNIIIHYKGENLETFLNSISSMLCSLVLNQLEQNIAKKILQKEYFYFDSIEKKQILNKIDSICIDEPQKILIKEQILYEIFYNFLKNNNKIFLKGFITFRLKKYISELENIVEEAVNEYVIEKEYTEFVSLLKLYVNSKESLTDVVHLIYRNENSLLLDKNKTIIKTDINLLNAKFLSDISFSTCDMILNTLLNILPQQIYIHLITEEADEFINTLNLIFENKIHICTDCNICRIYKLGAFGDGGKKHL